MLVSFLFVFFSSRRRHTRYWRDWSSDVCSSDLVQLGTRPQTMYGLNDSPVGLAAMPLDHDPKSYDLIIRGFVGGVEAGLTRDDFFDNVSMFWLTNTGVSSSKSFWEYFKYGSFANVRNVTVPVA